MSGSPSPSPTQTTQPPIQLVKRPDPICVTDGSGGYGELTIVVPLRYVDVRGSLRVIWGINKIVTPDGKVKWQVQVGGFGEGAVQTPALSRPPGSTFRGDLTAWAGLNATGMQTYTFDNEAEARAFPKKYAEARAKQIAGASLKFNPIAAPLLKIPFLGDKIRDAFEAELPPADKTSLEVGPTGGLSVLGGIFAVEGSMPARAWSMTGVQRDKDGNTIFNLRDKALADPTLVVDLNRLPKEVTKKGAEGILDYLEMKGKADFGPGFQIPPKLRDYIMRSVANGVKLGITVEFIIQNEYQYMIDKNGRPKKFTQTLQTSFTIRGRGAVTGGGPKIKGPFTGQVPLDGGKAVTMGSLDLSDPENNAAARNLLLTGALMKTVAGNSIGTRLTPPQERINDLIERKGTLTKLTYDELGGGVNAGLTGFGKTGSGAGRLEVEQGQSTLTKAEIWQDGKGWVPWTDCHR